MLWSAFMPELLTYAQGCPVPTAESKVRQAAIEFFRRTRAWVEWLDPVALTAGNADEYGIDTPTGSEAARIEQATLDGEPLTVVASREVASDFALKVMSGQQLVSRDLKTFYMGGTVTVGALVQVQAALVPSRTSTGIPDDLADKYFDDIVHGARARILSIPKTDFYDPDITMLEQAAFEAAIAKKSVDAWRGLTKNTPRSRITFC